MPPQPYVTGPAHLFVGPFSSGGYPLYLGTAEKSPRIEIVRGWFPWYDDEGGASLPADELYEAEEALVVADVNRWDEAVYAAIAAVVNRNNRGTDFDGEVGTSMVMESAAYQFVVQFPYQAKPTMATQPAGYRFPYAALVGPDVLGPLSHEPGSRRLVWRCRRYLDVVTGEALLYDNDIPALPQVA